MNRLPQLILPHGRDQADNAMRVGERGAGLSLVNTASTAEIRHVIERLLTEESFRAAARRLGDAVAEEAERSTLIEDLEQLAARSIVAPMRTAEAQEGQP